MRSLGRMLTYFHPNRKTIILVGDRISQKPCELGRKVLLSSMSFAFPKEEAGSLPRE